MAALLGLISIFSVIDLNSSLPGQDNRASGSNHSSSFAWSLSAWVCNNKIKPFRLTFHLCGAIEEELYCNELKYLPLFLMNANIFNILMTYAWVSGYTFNSFLQYCAAL